MCGRLSYRGLLEFSENIQDGISGNHQRIVQYLHKLPQIQVSNSRHIAPTPVGNLLAFFFIVQGQVFIFGAYQVLPLLALSSVHKRQSWTPHLQCGPSQSNPLRPRLPGTSCGFLSLPFGIRLKFGRRDSHDSKSFCDPHAKVNSVGQVHQGPEHICQ